MALSLERERKKKTGKERETHRGVREGLEEREERREREKERGAVLVVPPPWCIWNLEPLNACATLSERQRKKERLARKARLGSAFCERGSFVVTTKPEEYPSFKCGTAAIEWPRPPFLESRAHTA